MAEMVRPISAAETRARLLLDCEWLQKRQLAGLYAASTGLRRILSRWALCIQSWLQDIFYGGNRMLEHISCLWIGTDASPLADIGSGLGVPAIEFGARVQGPIQLGDALQVAVCSIVLSKLTVGSLPRSSPRRMVTRKGTEAVV